MFKEFKEFALKGNVTDMAVGIIIGAGFGKIVTSLVNDVIMPPIGFLLGGINFSKFVITLKKATETSEAITLNYGLFINTVIDFIIVAFVIFTDWNPIYSAFIALMAAGLFAWYCRPDLKKKMIVSAFLFLGLYVFYFLTLIILYPGYVERVWNLKALSGILILGIPLEELMFAFGVGFLWSSYYEHFTWHKVRLNINNRHES